MTDTALARQESVEQVKRVAEAWGVSTRTVYRWFAAIRASGTRDISLLTRERVCDCCGTPFPEGATIRRRYCDGACRISNHRHPGQHRRPARRRPPNNSAH